MICVALFTVASLCCGLAQNLGFLIFARVFQGVGGGGLAPTEQSILTDTFPPEKRGGAFALYGMTVICAPIFGPTVGGFITDQFSWHWIFLLNVPLGLISLFLVQTFVVDPPKLEQERRARLKSGLKVDGPGIVLLVLWLGCLEYALDRGQRLDWLQSGWIVAAFAAAAVSLVFLFIWEWDAENPIFDVRLFSKRSLSISFLAMMSTAAVFLGTVQLIPQFAQEALGYTATTAGLAMTFGGIVIVMLMPVAGKLITYVQPKYMMMAGLTAEVVGLLAFSRLAPNVSWWWLAFARAGLAIGIPFLFIPINTAAYADIPGEMTSQVSAKLNLARNLGGSLAISIAQAMLEQRQQFHQSRLVETVAPGNSNFHNWTSEMTTALSQLGTGASNAAIGEISNGVMRQAEIMAYGDVFWSLGIVTAILMPVLFFMRRVKPHGTPAG
jgi:DHA2 family multidrug resistance protein